jgi:UDP-GlcNAc:undecaprenyl-phosphate GlcNAc-1-phosphate transferase
VEPLIEVVREYLKFGLIAFAVTIFATPIAIRAAQRFGAVDAPDQRLKPHARPTPYLGGVAICLGWAVALVTAIVTGAGDGRILLPILIGGILVSGVGLIDDRRQMSPKLRLLLCTGIVVGVILATGAGLRLFESVIAPLGIRPPAILAIPLSFLAGVFIVLGACNSANLIDGLDGLCTGVTAIISLGFFLLATHLAVWEYSQAGDPVRLVLAIAMFGAALGFLPLNFNPAKIFMGDAGSILLGYNCGLLILLFAERSIARWVFGGLMVFALPVFDTALAVFRRWRYRRSIFCGDRSHFYDQLVDRGMSVKRVVLISYVLAALYAALGCLPIWVRTRYIVVLYAVIVAATMWVIHVTKMVRVDSSAQGPAGETGDS